MAAFPFQFSPHTTPEEESTKSNGIEANPHHPSAVAVVKEKGNPVKYLQLCQLYSASSSAGGSPSVMSNKVKARKLLPRDDDQSSDPKLSSAAAVPVRPKPPIVQYYSLVGKCNRARVNCSDNLSVFDALALKLNNVPQSPPSVVEKMDNLDDKYGDGDDDLEVLTKKRKKRSKTGCTKLINLGSDLGTLDGPRLQEDPIKIHNFSKNDSGRPRKQRCKRDANGNAAPNKNVNFTSSSSIKRWVWLSFDGIDPKKFIGLECKVYWPLDADWYSGRIVGYDLKSDRHQVEYEDGEEENVILQNERIKFYITSEEIKRLRLSINPHCSDTDDRDLEIDDMVVLATCLDDCHEIGSGDIIWAKLTGHSVWPAVVLDESLVIDRKCLNKCSGEKSVVVQFFGTHDFARVRTKQVISFLKGLLSSYCSKCKKPDFIRSLEEAKMYLSKQKLPKRMLRLRKCVKADYESTEDEGHVHSGDECSGDESIQEKLNGPSCPFEIGDLQVQSLGEIVKDLKGLKDKRYISPIGYKAVRMFLSITDPSQCIPYTMEVLRDVDSKNQPLFRVTSENGEQWYQSKQ